MGVMERRVRQVRSELYTSVCDSIRTRLADVCAEMDAESFNALVQRAAAIQIKYEARLTFEVLGSN
jgi:hypothetical protein